MNHTSLRISNHDLGNAAGNAIWESSFAKASAVAEANADRTEDGQPDIELGKEDLAAIADRRFIDALDFDSVKASQARSDFIKATIIFFGLDGECPSLSAILSA